MTLKDNVCCDKLKYTVVSISKITSPYSILDEPWYQYIIGRSNNCVKGMRQGTLEEVTEHAECIADDLNSRRNIKTGPLWRTNKPQLNTTPK